ncbi:hypothetical protein TWF281_007845 [Arthrobotrys megalospora]
MDVLDIIELAKIFQTFTNSSALLISKQKSAQQTLYDIVESYPLQEPVISTQWLKILNKFSEFTSSAYKDQGQILGKVTNPIYHHVILSKPTTHKIELKVRYKDEPTPLPSAVKTMPYLTAIASVAATVLVEQKRLPITEQEFHFWAITYLHFCSTISEPMNNDPRFRPIADLWAKPLPPSAHERIQLLDTTQPSAFYQRLQLHASQFYQRSTPAICAMCGWGLRSSYELYKHWKHTHNNDPNFWKYWEGVCHDCHLPIPFGGRGYHQEFCFGYKGLGSLYLAETSYPRFRSLLFQNEGSWIPIKELLADANRMLLGDEGNPYETSLDDERFLFILESFNYRMLDKPRIGDFNENIYKRVHGYLVEFVGSHRGTGAVRPANVTPLAEWARLPGFVGKLLAQGQLSDFDAATWLRRYKIVCYLALQSAFAPADGHLAGAMFPTCRVLPCAGYHLYDTVDALLAHLRRCHEPILASLKPESYQICRLVEEAPPASNKAVGPARALQQFIKNEPTDSAWN